MESATMEKSKIQLLYEACSVVFSQTEFPNFHQIQWLKTLLDIFEAKDVGIDEFGTSIICGSPSSSPKENNNVKGLICGPSISEITYVHIYECDDFSIGVFCLPAGRTFPLHDHPGMTVFSKLLYGSVYAKAYDWTKVYSSSTSKTFGLAGKVRDEILRGPNCGSCVLFPTSGGNIHSFSALTPCAILDVLAPPYSDDLGRSSTYFSDFPIPFLPGYVVLEERDLPDDLVVAGTPYLGPPIDVAHDFC